MVASCDERPSERRLYTQPNGHGAWGGGPRWRQSGGGGGGPGKSGKIQSDLVNPCSSIRMPHNPNTLPGNLLYNFLFTMIP